MKLTKMSIQILTKENIKEIALKYAEMGPQKLGKKFGVSRQRIQQIATQLRNKYNLDIPSLHTYSPIKKAVQELLEENKVKKNELHNPKSHQSN